MRKNRRGKGRMEIRAERVEKKDSVLEELDGKRERT